ncbi:HlyD family secretion protein [Shewanella intestini]|uniref:HlyD family secretion protein n=1 Tax=Shewanella intestini TaxID=2017544 RepID=A0ABS5I371_9GAMM|nr:MULTISPECIES: HlyD family secretion protein [Shewanella]MBR9728482.1 HlyD family secretion protein [Shewanella intestini]MRG36301.1 HlyD family efflux transporter periplasmic adaptor subunit [Shewanella sp. XMDDZSB0408]
MSKSKMFVGIPLIVLAVLASGYYWWTHVRNFESTDNAYIEADISNISIKVPGYVTKTFVSDNQHVSKGELLAQLEDNQYQAKVAQSQAALTSAQAQLSTLVAKVDLQRAVITQANASVSAAQAGSLRAKQQLARASQLKKKNYSSQDAVDEAQTGFQSAMAHVDEAKAALVAKQRELTVYNAQLAEADASVEQAKAGLALAKIQLNDTKIVAPFSGIIGKRGAHEGQYVQPGQAIYSLVPDHAIWITANFKETQIADMQVGQPVTIELDAYSNESFTGVVDSLSPASGAKFSLLPAENATGNFTKIVQRIPVRIKFNHLHDTTSTNIRLLPGLSALVKVDVSSGVINDSAKANP